MLAMAHAVPADALTVRLSDPTPCRAPSRRPSPRARPRRTPSSPARHDERLVALTIWGEARGTGDVGMRAVANVIMNRARAGGAAPGSGTTEVVWRPGQFSCWDPHDPNRAAMRRIASLPHESVDYQRWVSAMDIAHAALRGRLRDRTGGAIFYHNAAVKPRWHRSMKLMRTAWGHSFYKPLPART